MVGSLRSEAEGIRSKGRKEKKKGKKEGSHKEVLQSCRRRNLPLDEAFLGYLYQRECL